MHVVHHAHLASERIDGELRLVAACREQGIAAFEIWLMTLDAGAASREQCHAGELVVIAQQGSGKLLVDGGPQRFHAPCSLLIPPGRVFQIANNGAAPLQLVWVCTQAPQPADDNRLSSSPSEPTP